MKNIWEVKSIKMHFNLDTDCDNVLDWRDCRPFNPKRQDTNCPYCNSPHYKLIYESSFDNTGNLYECLRCHRQFSGDDLRTVEDRAYKARQRGKTVTLYKCRRCHRTFRQDNRKFQRTKRCPDCGSSELEIRKYVPPRKQKQKQRQRKR